MANSAHHAWIESYSPELDNLRASLEWAFGDEGDPSIGLDLVGFSMRLLFERSLFPELIRWVDVALAHVDDRTEPATAARVWLAKNFSINSLGNPVAAAAARRAAELCRDQFGQTTFSVLRLRELARRSSLPITGPKRWPC